MTSENTKPPTFYGVKEEGYTVNSQSRPDSVGIILVHHNNYYPVDFIDGVVVGHVDSLTMFDEMTQDFTHEGKKLFEAV